MTAPVGDIQPQDQKQNDKEYNFRALEAKYRRELDQERAARMEAERLKDEAMAKKQDDDDDDSSEPYVEKKKLKKEFNQFGQATKSEIQKAMEMAKQAAKEELKQEIWMEQNPDFFDVLKHADKFAENQKGLADTILRMPEGFERQKLVYQNIKALGLHKPPEKQSTVQEKIEANKRSPYYQPSGIGTAPYAGVGDYSDSGQKTAYNKMQELKKQLRL